MPEIQPPHIVPLDVLKPLDDEALQKKLGETALASIVDTDTDRQSIVDDMPSTD